MSALDVQTLILRPHAGKAVTHLLLSVPDLGGRHVAELLADWNASFGPRDSAFLCMSVGFTFAGLHALGLPDDYLRIFRRLAPAFAEGAVRRSAMVRDIRRSEPSFWRPPFEHERTHVVVSWHGRNQTEVAAQVDRFAAGWRHAFGTELPRKEWTIDGERLGAPPGEAGEWVHFGYRDGVSEVVIDDETPLHTAPDRRAHAPGALLLGHINDAGHARFVLDQAPEKVRAFFRDSSFGILRQMEQNLAAFEHSVDGWVQVLNAKGIPADRNFVKAKLCGRWPNGLPIQPGARTMPTSGEFHLALDKDPMGQGCPFGSHVRRLQDEARAGQQLLDRSLQRRSYPYGRAHWEGVPDDKEERGLIGHFFCASIEEQFEHLLGQWAALPPPGSTSTDRALDPFVGPHEDPDAALELPVQGQDSARLKGFSSFTTNLGTLYAWYPSRLGLKALLEHDVVSEEDEGPWL